MNEQKPSKDARLNPDLRAEHDKTYGRDHQGRAPMETVSSDGKEGRSWPVVWLVVLAICIALSIYILSY